MKKTERKISYIIPDEYDGKKVISYLRGSAGISTRLLNSLKRTENGITLNGKHIRTIDLLSAGDRLCVNIPCPESKIEPIELPLEILYEDEDIIAVNKSPYLACHPTHNHQGDTLANALAFYLGQKGKPTEFKAVGRLDKGTSGIVICALNKFCAAKLSGNIRKEYFAVVGGKLENSGTIDAPIYRPDPLKTLRAAGPDGLPAVTHWQALKTNGELTLVRIRLETGRTHQIRVHFSSIGMPLLGDSMYGGGKTETGHQLLHCGYARFIHPVSGEEVEIHALFPEDMQKIADSI